jgi:hypothetical protein
VVNKLNFPVRTALTLTFQSVIDDRTVEPAMVVDDVGSFVIFVLQQRIQEIFVVQFWIVNFNIGWIVSNAYG